MNNVIRFKIYLSLVVNKSYMVFYFLQKQKKKSNTIKTIVNNKIKHFGFEYVKFRFVLQIITKFKPFIYIHNGNLI